MKLTPHLRHLCDLWALSSRSLSAIGYSRSFVSIGGSLFCTRHLAGRQVPNRFPCIRYVPWFLHFALCILNSAFLLATSVSAAEVEPIDITGVIFDEAGEPIKGVQISVDAAKPRRGDRTVCPSCFPDCLKTALTNDKGEFKLPAMDGTLVFRLLFAAKGYESKAMDKVDAERGPINVSLWKRGPLEDNQRMITVRIYGSDGKPFGGAVLEIQGAETGNMTTWGGHKKYIQELAVSDANGIMTLMAMPDLIAGRGVLEARGKAKQWVKVTPGSDQIFILRDGVTVAGRVTRNGKPEKGLMIGFSGSDRGAGDFYRGYDVATDADGKFTFANVTANQAYYLYSLAKSSATHGVFPVRAIKTAANGDTLNLGTIELAAPLHIRGKIIFEDGEAAFPGSKINLGREQAWDYQDATIGENGEFEFKGLAPELVDISVRISGYKFSKKNPNRMNTRSLSGKLNQNLDDFLIILEPTTGTEDPNSREDYDYQARERALVGAKK